MTRWLPIPGLPLYEASDDGRVRNIYTNVTLSPRTLNNGYKSVTLFTGDLMTPFKEKRQKSIKVHRLVALAFVPNPDAKPAVNHKDGDRTNNAASNLEWVTDKENYEHAAAQGKHTAETNPNKIHKLTPADLEQCRKRHAAGETFSALAREFGMQPTNMARAIRGRPRQKYIPRPGVSRSAKSREEAAQRRMARQQSRSPQDTAS